MKRASHVTARLQKEALDILATIRIFFERRVYNSIVLPRNLNQQKRAPLSIEPRGSRKLFGRELRKGQYVLEIEHSDPYIANNELARKRLFVSIRVEDGRMGASLSASLGVSHSEKFGAFKYLGGGKRVAGFYISSTRFSLDKNQRWVAFTLRNNMDRYINFDSVSLIPLPNRVSILDSIGRWLSAHPNAIESHFILYADIDVNIVDGSSVWLSSMVSVLCELGPTILILKKPVQNKITISNIASLHNIFFFDPEDFGFVTKEISVCCAVEIIELMDGMLPDLRGVFIRGMDAGTKLHRTRQFYERSFSYLTDFYSLNGGARLVSDEQSKAVTLIVRHSAAILTQTEEIRRLLTSIAGMDFESIDFPPPVPKLTLEKQPHLREGAPLLIGYAGKISPNWGVEQLLDWISHLRSSGKEVELHCVVNKISNGNQPGFAERIRSRLKAAGANLYTDLNREGAMQKMSQMHLIWCWRPADFEDSTLELSTKLVEMVASGARCVCFPGPVNQRVLGPAYPFFARNLEELDDILSHGLDQPVPTEISARLQADHSPPTLVNRMASRLDVARSGLRVCFAAHDFKFIDALLSHCKASGHSVIRDYWEWGSAVDVERSKRNLEWADLIFCEWGLANAVWYSQNNNAKKPLFIRVHAQEVKERALKFGHKIAIENVTKIIFVAEDVRRRAIDLFGWPEGKTVCIPNYVLTSEYRMRPPRDVSEIHLGMVGIIPKLKRFDRAIEVLSHLVSEGREAYLHIKGPRPETLEFMHGPGRRSELVYYEEIYRRIESDPSLRGRVDFAPWGNDVADWYYGVDYILSPSDSESFHYALADGVLSGCFPVVWPWDFASELYSRHWIVESVEVAADRIVSFWSLTSDEKERILTANRGLVEDRYGQEKVFKAILEEVGLA